MSVKTFKETWVKENIKMFSRMYPDLTKEQLKQFLEELFDERVIDRRLVMDNNHINKAVNSSILEIYEWIQATKPIIAGNGVFYRNQSISQNPTAVMINKFLTRRKFFKDTMKTYKEGTYEYETYDRLQLAEKVNANSIYGVLGYVRSFFYNLYFKDTMKTYKEGTYEYETYDRLQLAEKVNANSIYGVLGYVRSFFYNLYTATSVTSTGQSLISTSVSAFEQFMTNSVKFLDVDDFRHHVYLVLSEDYELNEKLLVDVPREKLIARLLSMFLNDKGKDKEVIQFVTQTISQLKQKEVNRIYYKNNIYAFTSIPDVKKIWVRIFENVGEFKDPNHVPDNIKEDLDYLWDLYKEFVVYNHFAFNRIERLKTHTRRSVVAEDTDSTMINLNPWVEYVFTHIGEGNKKILSKDYNEVRFAAINTLCYILTKYITLVLDTYTARANVLPDYQKYINMKNEFLFSRLILSPVKKRYISTVRLREGKEFWPEKIDIKGKHCPIWQ